MKSLEALASIYCSQELTQVLDNQIIVLSVINTLLAITAIVGNSVIQIAIHKGNSLHEPSRVLLQNLVASDLFVGFIELLLVDQWISILQEHWQSCHYFYLAYIMGAFVSMSLSLGTLAAISIDRLLALFLGLNYRQVVTLRRVYVVVIAVWVLSVDHATLALLNPDAVKVVQAIGSIMCLITASFCYTDFS